MKVLLYSEGKKLFSKSGVGRALKHQMIALERLGSPTQPMKRIITIWLI